jgi:hypothetical protein
MTNVEANFDLNKSISAFLSNVQELLEIKEVSTWDGNTFREREEKIRDATLVLAGQCIGLLLYNLSQSPEAQATAKEKTRGWWLGRKLRNLNCSREILTLGNVIVKLKLPYMLERGQRQPGEKKKINEGFCPFLSWLGMVEGVTPLAWSTIAKYGTISSSFEIARTQLIDWGIKISVKRIQRLTYQFGKIGLSLRNAKILSLDLGTLIKTEILKDKKVVISVDGGRIRERLYKGERSTETNRYKYTGEWREPKVMSIYVVDEKGKKIKNGEIPITNDGTFDDYKVLLKILETHLVNLGIAQAKEVLFIADATEWMWLHIPPLLFRLGCPEVTTYQLIDFYHVAQHLSNFSKVAFSDKNENNKWFKSARSLLKQGQISNLLEQMNIIHQQASNSIKDALMSEINYLTNRNNEGRLNYPQVAARNFPIGSGAIESLIRQVVNLRLKGQGKFWLKENAEIMLHSRCQWAANNWNNFCNSIFTSFIYPATH